MVLGGQENYVEDSIRKHFGFLVVLCVFVASQFLNMRIINGNLMNVSLGGFQLSFNKVSFGDMKWYQERRKEGRNPNVKLL